MHLEDFVGMKYLILILLMVAYSNINSRLIFNLKEYITEPILIGISNLHFFPIVINDQILLTEIYLNKDVKFL